MFWADTLAQQLKERNLSLEWVDDMKTPSGRIHVGALRGVVVHDLVYRALKDTGVKAKYTYVFENHDPMDDIPSYLPRERFEPYLGMPLFKIPSPEEGYANYAEFYAEEFKRVFNAIGSYPEILWTKDLYTSGKMNPGIKTVLDNAEEVRKIYKEMYKKDMPTDWFPFQVYCEQCGKVSTTRVYAWDGEQVAYRCPVDAVAWTKGCGYEGKTSPFSDETGMKGKLPWKVEWPVKWQAIGVTVEGAGKDHMSAGGSHDLAKLVCERIIHYPVPYPIPYEWLLIGGRKMSSSKGVGTSAKDILDILPPELIRFLMVKNKITQQINFDPAEGDTIPRLFDEYQRAAEAYFSKIDDDLARIFELSQIGEVKRPPTTRFSVLTQWVQMPNLEDTIKTEGLEDWARYARYWVEHYASDTEKFVVQKELPSQARVLSIGQKQYLQKLTNSLEMENPEEFQKQLFEIAKESNITSKEAFSAIYAALLGKNHGPKAGWLILSLDKEFVRNRFQEVAQAEIQVSSSENVTSHLPLFSAPDLFTIAPDVTEKYPSVSVGIAVIKGVNITERNDDLEKEKQQLISSFSEITTEQINQFPEVQSYRQLYKAMGVDWHSRRPSPEALLRRLAQQKGFPTVNTCVDAYNLVVLKHKVSIGAFDFDAIKFPTILRHARDEEKILLLGDTEQTTYKATELAYFDQRGGYNIDFNYRDAQRTAVTTTSKNLYINIDGVFAISPEKVQEVLDEACEMIVRYCGGAIETKGVIFYTA